MIFSKMSYVKSHRTKHKDKNHICTVCFKGFTDPSRLIIHMRVHTKERPYSCDSCEKTFKQLGHLNHHKKSHLRNYTGSDNLEVPDIDQSNEFETATGSGYGTFFNENDFDKSDQEEILCSDNQILQVENNGEIFNIQYIDDDPSMEHTQADQCEEEIYSCNDSQDEHTQAKQCEEEIYSCNDTQDDYAGSQDADKQPVKFLTPALNGNQTDEEYQVCDKKCAICQKVCNNTIIKY